MAAKKGRRIRLTKHIAIQGATTFVPLDLTLEVPAGMQVEVIGFERGDPKWNDGQGNFLVRLSVSVDEPR